MKNYIRMTVGVLVLVLLGPAPTRAEEDTETNRARNFLESDVRTKNILFCAHPEAEMQRVTFHGRTNVVDGQRNPVAGHFALIYRYSWKSGLSGDINSTDFELFFDQGGRFYALNAPRTTSFFRPFGISDIVITTVRDEIIRKVDRDGTEADKRLVRALIQNSDSRGLLTMLLKLDQP